MDFSQSEIRTINNSIKFVNSWYWFRWVLVITLLILIVLVESLISDRSNINFSGLLSVPMGLILGYLLRNWSKPKKESLLLKLVNEQSTSNKALKRG